MGDAVRCLIADDSAPFCAAASSMLGQAGITVVGCVSNSAEALKSCSKLRPDVVLVDIDLGVESGFELTEQLHRIGAPEPPPVILISSYAEQDYVEEIAASPAIGFLQKESLSAVAIGALLQTHNPDVH